MDSPQDRREVKRERTREAFVQAAARIIEREGDEAAAVRRVAHEAGYTLATLYKYVANQDELLWRARSTLVRQVALDLSVASPPKIDSWDALRHEFERFVLYFIERSKVFSFLYGRSLDAAAKPAEAAPEDEALAAAMAPAAAFLAGRPGCSPQSASEALELASYALMGLLTIAVGGNDGMDSEALRGALTRLCRTLARATGDDHDRIE